MAFEYDPDHLDINRRERVYQPYSGLDFRPADDRVKDFNEIMIQFDEKRASEEASRCIHCRVPEKCVKACPLHNNIPAALWEIEHGNYEEGARIFRLTNPMPEICGRICPQEALCEGACVLNAKNRPVHIGACEAFAADYQRKHGEVKVLVGPSTGKKVAIIGGGPAGLACAEKLLSFGHSVTIFESKPLPGGLLIYGIPGFKLSSEIFFARLHEFSEANVSLVNNITIGKDKTIDDLLKEGYDAVFIGTGAGQDISMNVPGENLPGVYQGINFIIQFNVDHQYLPSPMLKPQQVGECVVVVGGGDTSSDCIRTALRLGAKKVINMYRRTENEMPGVKKDRNFAREEGAEYLFLTQPVRFLADQQGKLASIECIRMELGEPDARGRRSPVPTPDSNFMIEADTAVLALGFSAFPIIGETTPGLEVKNNGLIVVNPETMATSRPGIFAGGDAVVGPSLVVIAVSQGQLAAQSIDAYLHNNP